VKSKKKGTLMYRGVVAPEVMRDSRMGFSLFYLNMGLFTFFYIFKRTHKYVFHLDCAIARPGVKIALNKFHEIEFA
jgi:hypothetical protein